MPCVALFGSRMVMPGREPEVGHAPARPKLEHKLGPAPIDHKACRKSRRTIKPPSVPDTHLRGRSRFSLAKARSPGYLPFSLREPGGSILSPC